MRLLARRVDGGLSVALSGEELSFLRVVLQSYMADLQGRAVGDSREIAEGVSLSDAAIQCFVDARRLEKQLGRWLTGTTEE